MNREQIIDFVQQAQQMITQAGEMQQNINQGKAVKDYLEGQGELERVLKMAKDLQTVQEAHVKALPVLLRKCRRNTVDDCETLVKDIIERLKLADAHFEAWRAVLATNELEIAMSGNEGREDREKQATVYKDRYEKALELAAAMVPSPGVVLL